MPFRNAETNKYCQSLVVLSLVAFTFCVGSPEVFSQAPENQREYDAAQADAVVALGKIEGLLTAKMLEDYTAIARDFRSLLSTGPNGSNRGKANSKILKVGLEYLILAISDLDVQEDSRLLESARKRIEGVLSKAGSLISNADDKKRWRQTVYEEAYPFLEQLLQNNLLSRSLAMEVLLSMEVVQPRGGARMAMFDRVDKALLEILTDSKQPDAVKLRAANAVKRFLDKADAIPQIQNALALALIAELKRKFVGWQYQNSIIMALEKVDAPRQLVSPRAPIVICAAVDVMSDKSQHIRTRCRAARLVGVAGWDAQINYDPIAWKIADVALDTALIYNQSKDKKDVQWLKCGWFLYTAFQAANRGGKARLEGILNRAPKSKVALGSYKAILPVLRVLMTGKGGLGAAAGGVNNWVSKNKPANLVYDAACPPVKVGGGAANANPAQG